MKRLAVFIIILTANAHSQVVPVADWYKTNYSDNIYNAGINAVTTDSNYNMYFTQNINRTNRTVYISLNKYSSEGDSLFCLKYEPDVNKSYSANHLQTDREGNLYAAGSSYYGGVTHPVILKYNSDGELLWQDDFSYSSEQTVVSAGLALFSNNNVVLAYQSVDTFHDYIMLKCYSPAGNALWTITMYDDTSRYFTKYLLSDASDYVYAVAAKVYNLDQQFTSSDFLLLKINTDGDIIWRKSIDYNPDSAVLDKEGNIILIGQEGGRIKKITPAGDIAWTYYNDNTSAYIIYNCGTVDSDNNIIAAGSSGLRGGSMDYFITKISPGGQKIWSRNFASEEVLDDKVHYIIVDKEDNIYISGESIDVNNNGPCYTVRYSKDGELNWKYRLNPDNSKYTKALKIFTDDNSRIYIAANNLSSSNINSYILMRLKQTGSVDVSDEFFNSHPKVYLDQNYPNPFNLSTSFKYGVAEECFVSVNIYDVLGRKIETLVNDTRVPGMYEVNFYAGDLSSGLYICTLKAGRLTESRKIILLK